MTKRRRGAAIGVVAVFGTSVVLVALPVLPAAADSWPCHNVSAGISSSSSRAVGTGTWNCDAGYGSLPFTTEVHVYHNYDWLPDADVFYGQWTLTGSTSNQSRSVQRCDQGTTADYYSTAMVPAFSTAWASSGLLNITTCLGTGS